MVSLVSGLLFVGYLLVYAAVKDSGKYADKPWAAIFPQGQTPAQSVRASVTGRTRPGGS